MTFCRASTSATTCWSRPAAGSPASARRTPPPSGTISRRSLRTWRRACARPRPISTSRRPRGCATSSSGCARPSWRWWTTRRRNSCPLLAAKDRPAAAVPAPADAAERGRNSKVHKPDLDEMGIALYHESLPHRPGDASAKARANRRSTRWVRAGVEALPSRPALDHRPRRHARRLEAAGTVARTNAAAESLATRVRSGNWERARPERRALRPPRLASSSADSRRSRRARGCPGGRAGPRRSR